MNKVKVSAPGKLMLFGEHAAVYNHPCIVTSVGKRLELTAEITDDQNFSYEALDIGIFDYKKQINELGLGNISKGVTFVEKAVFNFYKKYFIEKGINIKTKTDFSQYGFGGSSAVTVCTIKALTELFEIKLTKKEIFDLSYKTILEIQGKASGFDAAAAIWGGVLYFVTGGKIIEPLNIDSIPLLVAYSGIKADTVSLINKAATVKNREQIFKEIEVLTEKAKVELQKSNWPELGLLMNENQKLLEQLGVSIPKLDLMIKAARENGAWGAKLSGAGGGDCIIALVADDKIDKVKKGITEVGGQIIEVKTGTEGTRIENF